MRTFSSDSPQEEDQVIATRQTRDDLGPRSLVEGEGDGWMGGRPRCLVLRKGGEPWERVGFRFHGT